MRIIAGLIMAALAVHGQIPEEARLSFLGRDVVYLHAPADPAAPQPVPLIVFLHPDVAAGIEAAKAFWRRWEPPVAERGWRLVVPWAASTGPAWTDAGARAIEAVVRDVEKRFPIDARRIYIAGEADGGSQVFYLVSRIPDLWAAALVIQGNPKPAIESNRLFGANSALVPLLWVLPPEDRAVMEPFGAKMATQGIQVQIESGSQFTLKSALDWLTARSSEPFPSKIDCETGSRVFARCYWLEMTRFDPGLRNDVLAVTRVPPGSGASLDLGGFGFQASATGPGVRVAWLPENYRGPLKLDDRIVSIGGREIRDGQDYVEFMDTVKEEKTVGIVVSRGGKRQRLETRILLPRREENLTVRVQAEFLGESRELQLISRGVTGMRLRLPEHWLPCHINWNGTDAGKAEITECWELSWGTAISPCSQAAAVK